MPDTHEGVVEGRLLTRSCTTGWSDWIHGELWLLPSGLLRFSLGLPRTVLHLFGPTMLPGHEVRGEFDDSMIKEMVASDRHNMWLPVEEMRSARLRRGIITGSLRLELVDHPDVYLLWMRLDRVFVPMRAALSDWLGGGLDVV